MTRHAVMCGMPRTPNIHPLAVKRAPVGADSATNIEELRRAQAVLLPALLEAALAQTALALGVGVPPSPGSKRLFASLNC